MSRKSVEGSKGLRAAIMRLLAASNSQKSQRAVTVQDLAPAKNPGSSASADDDCSDAAARVEWSLRIMS